LQKCHYKDDFLLADLAPLRFGTLQLKQYPLIWKHKSSIFDRSLINQML